MDKMVSLLRAVSQSEDEGNAATEDLKRIKILKDLAIAIEKIQEKYTHASDTIKVCEEVEQLCVAVREILNHGLKEGLMSFVTEVSFWPVVESVTCKEAIDQISRLELAKEREKCDAWIMLAIKENVLGSYMNAIGQDEKIIKYYYHQYAFLCDKEKMEEAQHLVIYGISNFDFDLDISTTHDTISVEQEHNSSGTISPEASPLESTSTSVEDINEPSLIKTNKRKKRKSKSKTVSIDNPDEHEQNHKVVLDPFSYDSMYYEFDIPREGSKELNDSDISSADKQSQVEDNSHSHVSFDVENSGDASKLLDSVVDPMRKDEVDSSTDCSSKKSDSSTADLSASLETNEFVRNLRQSLEKTENDSELLNHDSTGETYEQGREGRVKTSAVSLDESLDNREETAFTLQDETVKQNMQEINDKDRTNYNNAGQNEPNVEHNENKLVKENMKSKDKYESRTENEHGTVVTEDDSLRNKSFEKPFSISSSLPYVGHASLEDELTFVPGIHDYHDDQRCMSRTSSTGSASWITRGDSSSRRNTYGSWSSSLDGTGRFENELLSSSVDSSGSPRDFESLSELEMFDDLLGLEENHFSAPESFMGLSTVEELQHAVESCKTLIKAKPNLSEERIQLVQRLVKLRLKLQEEKELASNIHNNDTKKILGHQFVKDENASKQYCDRCGKIIWVMWQSLFSCTACKYHCHRKCLETILRPCASKKVTSARYILEICPETGLSTQQYRCVECRHKISIIKLAHSEARLCDYSGQYFCEECHWNDVMVIPARVVHNWDFVPRKVSRQAKQQLRLMQSKPLLHIQELNPKLFSYIEELREISKLREDIIIMKKYFVSCKNALDSKLLLKLNARQHFVENSDVYSLSDLIGVHDGQLIKDLAKIKESFTEHIKVNCQLCRGRGFICELCESKSVIFEFDKDSTKCPHCHAVFHRKCFKQVECPRCKRIQKRTKFQLK